MITVERICKNVSCGKKFLADKKEVDRGWAMFCSKYCKDHFQNKYMKIYTNVDSLNNFKKGK